MAISRLTIAALLVAALASGCGSKGDSAPKTYKVTGTITAKSGATLSGAAVQLTHVEDSSFSVSGDVQADGSFSLDTIKGSERIKGVPEGEYRVMVRLPIGADHRPVPPFEMAEPFRVEAKDNHLPIDLTGPRKR